MPEVEHPPLPGGFPERLAGIAERLDIPKEECGVPQIRQFLEFVAKTEDLQRELAIAESRKDLKNSALTRPPHITSLSARYWRAENLLRGALAVLEEGLGPRSSDLPKYIKEKVTTAIETFGLKVVKKTRNEMKVVGLGSAAF